MSQNASRWIRITSISIVSRILRYTESLSVDVFDLPAQKDALNKAQLKELLYEEVMSFTPAEGF